jgi:(p)ppGpp synthase/HD superfamily hydrolase
VGFLKDVSTVVSAVGVNMSAIRSAVHDDGTVSFFIALNVADVAQLSRIFSKLEAVRGVISVSRSTEGVE